MHVVRHPNASVGGTIADQAGALLTSSDTEPVLRSWDTALVAIGFSHLDPGCGTRLLEELFASQWRNGLLPHLAARRHGDRPPWAVDAPELGPTMATSPLAHPPIHATAALRLGTALGTAGIDFLTCLYPRLAAWHDYLLASRVRRDVLLAEVWHPAETGMDNSPMWDEPLRRLSGPGAQTPTEARPGQTQQSLAQAADRLLGDMAATRYLPDRVRATTRFAVHDVLFNAVLVRAELDLAQIARRVGHNDQRHHLRSRRIATLINRELFDPHNAWYVDRDVLTGRRLPLASASQLAPLYAGVPDPARAALLADMWRAMSAPASSPLAGMMASADPEQPGFSMRDGWRGPAWYVTNWMVHEGLRAYGYVADAARLRHTMLAAVDRAGFWQHYDLFEGGGGGQPNHLPTAALALDLIQTEANEPQAA